VGEVWDRGKQGFQETDIENNGGAARQETKCFLMWVNKLLATIICVVIFCMQADCYEAAVIC
jgi:hypothetical protein